MQETIGQRLKREREARYLTLERASAETRIRAVFLSALEADDYSVMPSAAQGRGFLRNYAEYLALDIDELIAEIQRNPLPPPEVSGPLPQVNLVETEIPPLTNEEDEKPSRRFWNRFLFRKPKADATPIAVEENTAERDESEPAAETESQPTDEIQPDGAAQVKVRDEAKPGLLARLTSIFQFKPRQTESESLSSEPENEVQEETEDVQAAPSTPADQILAEIGVQLRERRELISLTIEEVERHTHMRAVFVKALEEGAFDKLPSPVQTRGMLVNYATFLDLDVDQVLLRFADALQARRREKYAETPRENIQTRVTPSIPFLRMFIAGDLLFGVVMIAILFALAIWGVGRIVNLQDESQAEPTAPSIVDVLGDLPLPTPSSELTFVPVDDPSLATLVVPGGDVATVEVPLTEATSNVTVSLFALERVFVRVSVDGEVAFEGRMAPRETKVFNADDQVMVLSGDGSALRVSYNGSDLGLMGGTGEVVNNVYTIAGVVTPTATIPPTPTNTPLVTMTLSPTPTSTMTPTPTVTTNP